MISVDNEYVNGTVNVTNTCCSTTRIFLSAPLRYFQDCDYRRHNHRLLCPMGPSDKMIGEKDVREFLMTDSYTVYDLLGV